MTLVLTRIDYATVGVTLRGTTQIFHSGGVDLPQKFAVGDQEGVLHIYGYNKKGEFQELFKSLPGPSISRLVLGGLPGQVRDKVFLSHKNTVHGFTRKGKIFLGFDSNHIESIGAMYVLGSDLAACARDVYHRYRDCKDADSYLVGEKLLDVVLLPLGHSSVIAVLACGDCSIRLLQGTRSPTVFRLPHVPTILRVYREGEMESRDRVLVGTMDGKVGLLIIDGTGNIRISWILNSPGSEITALDTYELQDGVDVIVGRQDGNIEIHTLPTDEDIMPIMRYNYNAGESISSIIGGNIGTIKYPEILVTTYSGKIFSLTTKPAGEADGFTRSHGVAKLRTEIQQLEDELKRKDNFAITPTDTESITPFVLAVNHRMILDDQDASYLLSVELDRAIDNIMIQADTLVKLQDVESNSAVVSLSKCDPREGNFVLATYRCQMNTNRLEVRIRSIEGHPGTLQVYVTSQMPPKCCRKIVLPICALSLHKRLYVEENEVNNAGPFNELRLVGGFSMAELHAWLSFALPDVPERPCIQEDSDEAIMIFSSTYVGTILKCKYKKGSASFLSENISTIIILRDILTKEATKRKIKLEVYCDINEASLDSVFKLIFPRLKEAHELNEKIEILNAINTWDMKNNPEDLCLAYQELLENESELQKRSAKDTDTLQRLHEVIVDLYVDWERAKNSRRISSKQGSEILYPALLSMDVVAIKNIFMRKDNSSPSVAIPLL